MFKKSFIAILYLSVVMTQHISAENIEPTENTEALRKIADRVEKRILTKYVFVPSKKFTEKIAEEKPLSTELMSDLEDDEDLKKLKTESPNETRRLKYRILKNMESAELQAKQESSKKEIRTNSLWFVHLASATGMIYQGVMLAIVLSGHQDGPSAGRCLLGSAVGAGLSVGVYYAYDLDYFNHNNDRTKINETTIMKRIVEDQIHPVRPTKQTFGIFGKQ
jgi:hypothetical protein